MASSDSPAADVGIAQADLAQVGRYIAENDTKGAVKKAKALHSQLGTAESEALLVDVYIARVQAMESAGLRTEAASLREVIAGRYACAAEKLRERHTAPGAAGDVLAMAGELARPDLPAARRAEIEEAIRRDVTELPRLARCEAIESDHPLAQAAGALCRAFEAVVTGPVDAEQIALREVSHRSALADWKLLIRALDCFYRHDDDACRRLLETMRPDSAAARLVPALRAMLDGRADGRLGPQAAALVAAVEGGDRELHQALAELEPALAAKDLRRLKERIQQAVKQCRKVRPELLGRLKQLISVRTFIRRRPVHLVIEAMGGLAVHDSAFWALLARAVELTGDEPTACLVWEEFRRHAVHEGRFAPDGAENSALYLHMLDLLRKVPPEDLWRDQVEFEDDFRGFLGMYEHQPSAVRALAPSPRKKPDLYCVYPEQLFERLCRNVADAGIYARWLEHARSDGQTSPTSEEVAERWHRAIPSDSRPLLFLMEQAESRRAFTKAMKYLRQAEALDALSPAVKRARLRLGVANALRHLQAGKWHLAAKDLAALCELPQSREGDRPAILAGLEWVGARQAGDAAAAAARQADLTGLFGDEAAAAVLLTCVGRAACHREILVPEGAVRPTGPALLGAVGRSCAACQDVGVPVTIPPDWQRALVEALKAAEGTRDLAQLRALAQGALGCVGQREIAFAATGAALRVDGPHRARFLLLRARCLLRHDCRRRECLEVAAELARRQRDTGLLAEVMDEIGAWFAFDRAGDITVADEVVERVLTREAQAAMQTEARPSANGPSSGPRRHKRSAGRPGQPALFEDLFDEGEDDDDLPDRDKEGFLEEDLFDEDDEDDEGDWDEEADGSFPESPPLEMMELFVEIMMRAGGEMPSPKKLDGILGSDPKLRERVMEVFRKFGPPAGFGEVLEGLGEEFDLSAMLPPWVGNGQRGKRKKQRHKRRR
jgi:tetratricopeptide (TPR) repeat protein